MSADPFAGVYIEMYDIDGTNTISIWGSTTSDQNGAGRIVVRDQTGVPAVYLDGETGDTSTQSLTITGGSDLAERFDVGSASGPVLPGMIVFIDPARPGKLIVSMEAYDRKVAGVVSAAGGVNTGMLTVQRKVTRPGACNAAMREGTSPKPSNSAPSRSRLCLLCAVLLMGQCGTSADGALPVALSGRVYCLTDATDAAVEPGDLLTTSVRAGQAMKVADHVRAQGAVIGKAMTGLERGRTGLVLVLVNLQ